MKKIISLLILISLNYVYSQEKVGGFKTDLKNFAKPIKKSFSIFNNYNENISTFLIGHKTIYSYLLNKNFKVKQKLTLKNIKRNYSVFIGKIYDEYNNYTLIFSNNKRNKFALIKFSFSTKETVLIEDKFNTKGFRFLQSVNKGNTSHLLFLDEKSSNIVSRNYSINGKKTSTLFNFEKERFLINQAKKTSLKKLLIDYTNPNYREVKNIGYELTKINDTPYKNKTVDKFFSTTTKRSQIPPTSLELTSRINKIYVNQDNVIITLDKNRFYTQILTLNLNDGNYSLEKIKKPLFNKSNMYKRSNSFIYNHFIFIVTSTKDALVFSIHNLKNKKLLKKIIVKSNEIIKFKNSPILQEGGAFKKYRNLEKTSGFLRKISESNIGIGVVKNNDGYEIVIGSEKQFVKGSSTISIILAMGLTGVHANRLYTDGFSRTNLNSFTNYLTTKSVRIHCLFDNNFNNKAGEIEVNLYDKITNFIKPKLTNDNDGIYSMNSEKTKVLQTFDVFKISDTTIVGLYFPYRNKYSFYKFN
ncbi:hypothetical protein [Tenacibaculum halocynthiae]|uniref:hypothetical protein n=1 Tax=Tenacibaculum halocynthiae TaxID=1254437 RepID=UPI0038953F2B